MAPVDGMEVIGNGMLAKAFRAAGVRRDRLVAFCSGVSDSKETSTVRFNREKSLLLDVVRRHQDSKIVYFSSCAAEFVDNPYYRHKRDMECCLQQTAREHLVCRLPQAVGVATNDTLVNHITRSVSTGRVITVTRNARRSLIDVDDVVRLTLRLSGLGNMQIGVTNGSMMPVEDLIAMVSGILDVAPVIEYAGMEPDYSYDGTLLSSLIGKADGIYAVDYNLSVLSKYVPLLNG